MDYSYNRIGIEAAGTYLTEAASILRARGEKLGLDVLSLLSSIGERADELAGVITYNEERAANSIASFFTEFAMLVHVLYPVMEQLETSVSRHVKFLSFPTDWEDHDD